MYKWYEKAELCYVFLSDFSLRDHQHSDTISKGFRESRWFRRGWTLQELLAPKHVVFYDQDWIEVGSRSFLEQKISEATGISSVYMGSPRSASVATKMFWAPNRQTSRAEDMAYSLLGLFDINMPLIYGEGMNAFFRLQSEIIRTFSDESIYAWSDHTLEMSGLLAPGTWAFRDSCDIVPIEGFSSLGSLNRRPLYMTSKGLAIEITKRFDSRYQNSFTVPLNCARAARKKSPFKLHLTSQRRIASRINVSEIEFYRRKRVSKKYCEVLEHDIDVQSELLYVENKYLKIAAYQSSRVIWPREQFHSIGVKITSSAQDRMEIFRYLESPKGSVEVLNKGEIRRISSFDLPEEVTIWFLSKLDFEFIIAWTQVEGQATPLVRIYSSNLMFDPSFQQPWEKSEPTNITRELPPPISILSEPFDSTSISLCNGEFLRIRLELREGFDDICFMRRVYTVHVDVTSIDCSRL